MRCHTLIAILCALGTCSSFVFAGGRIEEARKEIQEASNDDPPKKLRWPTGSSDDSCDEDSALTSELSDLLGGGILSTITIPWWGPRSLLADQGDEHLFASFPYADDWQGYLVAEEPPPVSTRSWSLRLASEYGDDFADMTRYGGRLRFDTASRWGFDTEWNRRIESLHPGSDSLWTGDANLVYRFAQSSHALFYTGLGVNWSADSRRGDVGFNFTYGADFFPCKPLVLSTSIDWGRIGDASLFHGRATIGAMIHRVEVYTGYDYLNLEGTGFPSLIGGVQITF